MAFSICVVVPFDIFSIKSGSSERIKSDLNALLNTGNHIELFLPLNKSQINNLTLAPNLKIHSYKNIQSLDMFSEKLKLLFDMYTQPINPFFRSKLKKNFQKYDLIFAYCLYSPLACINITQNKIPIVHASLGFEYGLIKQVTNSRLVHKMVHYIENYICKKSNLVLCVSDIDKNSLAIEYSLEDSKLLIIPNTISADFFLESPFDNLTERNKLGIKYETSVALFHGRMDYRPNLEALDFIQTQLIPFIEKMDLDIIILVVGAKVPSNTLKFVSNKFLVLSDVPDIRKYISISDVEIVPLLSGGGSRIKILECFASKIPVISTKKGAEGIDYFQYKNIIISELSPADFVINIFKLKNDYNLRETIVNNAFELLIENYSSKSIVKLFDLIIKKYKC